MNIKIVTGQTVFYAGKNLISKIDISDPKLRHIVLVPDRFSLQVESMIMDELDIQSTFNIEVLGISRLALRVLRALGIKGDMLGADECLLLTEQAIDNVKAQFKSFKKSSSHFAQEISKVISQFKSCGLEPNDLTPNSDKSNIQNKYHDLRLIYQEYQNLIGNRLDANGLLSLFSNILTGSKIFENTYFYLVGFDSFTTKMFDCIIALTKSAKGLFVALSKPCNRANEYIYEDDILTKLAKLCQENNITIQVQEEEAKLNDHQNAILNNMYSFSPKSIQNDGYFLPIACHSMEQEVYTVGKLINQYVRNKSRYKDMMIVCSDLEKYYQIIRHVFDELDIPFFADKSVSAENLILSQTVIKLLKIVGSGYSQESLLDYFTSLIVKSENTNEIVQTIKDFNVKGAAKTFKFLSSMVKEDLSTIKSLAEAKTNGDFCDCIQNFLDQKNQAIQLAFQNIEKDYLTEYNLNIQAPELLAKALESIKTYRKDFQTDANGFLKTLKLLLSFNQVSTVPTYVDSIQVGDVNASYFVQNKICFLLGGDENLPRTLTDNGIVSDGDIENVNFVREIEPSIKVLNRRSRIKFFSILPLAADKLIATYLTINKEGKSMETPNYIEQLCKIFQTAELNANYLFKSLDESRDEAFVIGLGSKSNALNILAGGMNNLTNRQFSSLMQVLNYDISKLQLNRDRLNQNAAQLFFPTANTKVTQLENYFSCPFKHFMRYGLKIREDQTHELEKNDIGNVCHRIAELLLKKNHNVWNLNDYNIQVFLSENLPRVLNELKLDGRLENLDDADAIKKQIFRQCLFILQRICYEQKFSRFKPKYFEKKLEGLSLEVEGNDERIKLSGKVDRIDIFEDNFRIIDYKTGTIHPLLKDLYYGDKLQLFIYSDAIEQMLKLKASGVFYFDCKFSFSDDDQEPILKGLICDDDEVVEASDSKLGVQEKSDLIAVAVRKQEENGKFKGSAITKNLKNFVSYAKKLSSKALGEIWHGFIEPKPDDEACSFCKFKSICLKADTLYREKGRVYEKDILGALKGEGND